MSEYIFYTPQARYRHVAHVSYATDMLSIFQKCSAIGTCEVPETFAKRVHNVFNAPVTRVKLLRRSV